MTGKLSTDELKWLREIAVADSKAENRIPQVSLARLLKYGLVVSYDMLTLRITRRGWKCLAVTAPDVAGKHDGRAIRYALVADTQVSANLRVER